MSANDALSKIPVVVEHVPGAKVLHPARRAVQVLTLLILVLIPVTGLFRIDPVEGAFVLLDHQVWFSDIFLVMGFWIFIASLLVMMYSLVGSVFCGWMCPQNTASEWANELTRKLLGRRANMMDITGERMRIARQRKSTLNYVVFSFLILLMSMFAALIPLLYFYPPEVIWSFVMLKEDARLAGSLHWIYIVCVAVMLIDIGVIRHLMCKYMCIYRVWQHSFKTRDTLRIDYDSSRSDHCLNCRYCVDACFLDIDPKQTEVFDSCVNCGECVSACDELHAKSKKLEGPGLLRFAIGDKGKTTFRGDIGSFFSRAKGATVATICGLLLTLFGVAGYTPASFSVYRGDSWQGNSVLDYRINLANKLYHPVSMQIEVEGLSGEHYRLEQSGVEFDTTGRKDVILHLDKHLPKGLHRFMVKVTSDSGWSDSFEVRHYASGGENG